MSKIKILKPTHFQLNYYKIPPLHNSRTNPPSEIKFIGNFSKITENISRSSQNI